MIEQIDLQCGLLKFCSEQIRLSLDQHVEGSWQKDQALEKDLNELTPIVVNLALQSNALLHKAVKELGIINSLAVAIERVPALQTSYLTKLL